MNKKALTLFVAATFVVSSFAPFVKAATIDELQAQINALLQQIAALQGTTTTTTGSSCFTTDLSQGMTSDAVKLLQSKLNVTPQTGYFGPLTLAAVKSYQAAHSIIQTGYVGPLTRAALNTQYCVATTTTTAAGTTTTTVANATEGTLTAVVSPTFVEATIKKGDVSKPILATRLEAKNSDITVKRVDYTLTGTSIQPWKTYTTLDLYVDGALVKSIAATKDNFIENTYGASYTLRYDGLSIVVAKGGTKDMVLKVSVQESPVNTAATTFTLLASPAAIRGTDTMGVDQYAPSANRASAALAPAASTTGSLTLSLNTNSPKTGFVIGNKTATTGDVKLVDIDFKATDRALTIKTLLVTITDANTALSAIKLYDGSTLLASAAGAGSADVTFSNLAIAVAKDTTKTLTVKADLKPIDGTTITEAQAIKAAITANATQITAVDDNDTLLGNANITGTTTGKTLTAYTKAPTLTFVSSSITKTVQAGQADQADATIVFDVTANGGDIFIETLAHAATALTVDDGVAGSDTFAGGLGTYTFTSTAENDTATSWKVLSGQTARFTVSGHVINKAATGYARMALDTIVWDITTGGTTYTLDGGVASGTANYDLTNFKTNDISLTHV